ncbi:hypothetical protein C3K47_12220 [Solitalea longa]|uniref:Cardiolipin synthase N-terminal domain-containing protein n=1 Tax=Solitalea longa TaxID=2079460 RepID=A0A2S5A078_9SPHI|nr:PLDc N-terminal domain-containing protein [Solitalea longa]POY35966.1 hypothetical protein C3K47_12220 [Solitalea longa]
MFAFFMCLLTAVVVSITTVTCIIMVAIDAYRNRVSNIFFWILLSVFLPIIGTLIYFRVRKENDQDKKEKLLFN